MTVDELKAWLDTRPGDQRVSVETVTERMDTTTIAGRVVITISWAKDKDKGL